ncbi:olfactory receptor 10T2-like [Tiliqua scincoides]|uniref:olfactory receptor 10T2-like n=1 Tax=Tiliqua scincoides TaxID=71010 RepID=UPI003463506C
MGSRNNTVVYEFILTGFSSFLDLKTVLFVVFFLIYLTSITANTLLITVIWVDRTLHTPMYFFLSVLSCSEICYSFVIVPKMLANLITETKAISFGGCIAQLFFFNTLGGVNCIILTQMGYDRYAAICHPLRYPVLMNRRICRQLVASAYIISLIFAIIEQGLIVRLPFCGPNKIHHFFCEMGPVLKLACKKSSVTEISIFIFCIVIIFGSFLLVLLSYALILNTIFKIPSTKGKQKAFSTCASHIIVVVVHFGCASIIYLRPKSTYSLDQDIFISVSYTMVTPLLNPLVYSLRNKDVQLALKNTLGRRTCMSTA